MSTPPINVPLAAPSFAFQGSHQPITNPLVISRRANTGLYPLNGLYAQQPHRNLGGIQRAHPELTSQERQYILHAKSGGAMDALSTQQLVSSQSLGGFLSVFPNGGRIGVSSVPLSRTESCPLPGPPSGKSQVMKRQHSSIDPSTIPEHLLGPLLTGTTDSMYSQSFQTNQDPSIIHATANNTVCLVPALSSSFPPYGLPIQHISAPGSVPSGLVGYLSQTFRDDPFSSVRGGAQNNEQGTTENISVRGVSGNIGASGLGLSQAGLSTQYSHFSLPLPYTISMSDAAFTAPRMEAQQSTSTFFDSASTNADLESGDEFLVSEMDMRRSEMNEELQSELAGLIDMSASQLTVRDDRVPMLPIHLSSFNSGGGALDFTKQAVIGSFEQTLPADLHLLPELTDTVGTPSSPAQMSRQPSGTTNYANSFNSFGTLPQAPGPMDALTAPEMGREWSDLSNPAIHTFSIGGAPSSDGQYQRKRSRQPPAEDIELLLKGAGVATAAPAAYDQYVDIPGAGAWHGLGPQLSYAANRAATLEDFGGESGADESICTNNPVKLRRVDGRDVCDARIYAKSVEPATLGYNFVPTTCPLPAFDQHLAMSRSVGGAPLNATQPVTRNTQQVVTATTTTVTTSAAQNVTRSVPRPRASSGLISINSQTPSRSYVRRTHPRAYCDQCNEVRDGFRGDHELRRHKERAHAVTQKVWVTKDISPDGDFLADCKACKRGKHYFADYNAAAHLRRQHFCKRKVRGRLREVKRESEPVEAKLKRWGMDWREGGPYLPGEFSMRFLRRWMEQIEVPKKVYNTKRTAEDSFPDEEGDGDGDSDEVKERDLESNGKGDSKGVPPRSTALADVKKSNKVSHRNPTESGVSSNTLQPETKPQQTPFQPPPLSEQIEVVPSTDVPSNLLQTQELQELLAPAMDKVDLSIESFYHLQNGLG